MDFQIRLLALRKHWGRLASSLVTAIAALFLAWAFYANWRRLPGQGLGIDIYWLGFSIAGGLSAILLQAVSWGVVLRLLGQPVGWQQGIRLWIVAQTAKYVPGSVWNWVARVYLAGREGMSHRVTAASIVAENVFLVLACLLIIGIFGIPAEWFTSLRWLILTSALAVELLFVLWPSMLTQIARRLSRDNSDIPFRVRRRDILATSAIYLINMLLAGVVWFLFIRAFHPISLGSLPGVVGSVIFAFIIGYLAVFTPQGWGIREGILSALLAYYMPAPLAVMVAVLARLWTIVDEVMALGLVLLLRRFRESNDRRRAGKSDSVVAI